MKLVTYLYKRFVPVFLGALGFFALVLVLVDLLMNLWKYIQNEATPLQVAQIMLLYVPKTVWYAVPLAVLFASSYTLSNLYASNELTAVFASGVSLLRFTMPLLVFSVVMSFALFVFEDALVVPTYARKQELQNLVLKEERSLNNDRIVVLSDASRIIYKAQLYEDAQKRLYDVYFLFRGDDRRLLAVIHADAAVWDDGRGVWRLQNGIQYTWDGSTLSTGRPDDSLTARLDEPCETFRNNTVSVEEVNTRQAKVYIEHLRRTGLPYSEELSVYYKKFAFPFVVFIVVFLSIGLSGKSRKNVLLLSLASSVSAAVLFYVTQMITMLLAKFGYISPFSGAWFSVILFTAISAVLLHFART